VTGLSGPGGDVAAALVDVRGESRVVQFGGVVQGADGPAHGGFGVAGVLVEPAEELRVPGTDTHDLGPDATVGVLAQLLDERQLALDRRDQEARPDQRFRLHVLDEHRLQVVQHRWARGRSGHPRRRQQRQLRGRADRLQSEVFGIALVDVAEHHAVVGARHPPAVLEHRELALEASGRR
jgi:hypothetical protein